MDRHTTQTSGTQTPMSKPSLVRVLKASEFAKVDLIAFPDGHRFALITFTDGDVELMRPDDFQQVAHRIMDWAMILKDLEVEADRVLADRGSDTE